MNYVLSITYIEFLFKDINWISVLKSLQQLTILIYTNVIQIFVFYF